MRGLILLVALSFTLSTCAHFLRTEAERIAARAERGDLRMAPR